MLKKLWQFMMVLVLLLSLAAPALAQQAATLAWLQQRQANDGGFAGDFDKTSSVSATAETIFALVAAGEDPTTWAKAGQTPLTFLTTQADTLNTPGDWAKVILAFTAAKQNPRQVGQVDLIARLEGTFDAKSGLYGGVEAGNVFGQSLAILALTATKQPVPAEAVTWLTKAQLADGSWSWNGDTTPGAGDTNSTAIAWQALLAAGETSATKTALAYLTSQQNDDGGFPYQKPSPYGPASEVSDANSTAYIVQALVAAGEDLSRWAKKDQTPLTALAAFRKANGAFQWQAGLPDDNFLATTQASAALTERSFAGIVGVLDAGPAPVTTTAPAATPTLAAPAQLPTTGGVPFNPTPWLFLLGLLCLGLGLKLRPERYH